MPKPAGVVKASAPEAPPAISRAPSPSVARLPSPPKTVATETTAQTATPHAPPDAKPEPTSAPAAPILPKSADNSRAPAPEPAHDNRSDAAISASARPCRLRRTRPRRILRLSLGRSLHLSRRPSLHPSLRCEPIRETVVGNTYTNETYGFQMYKPPTWEVIAGVPGAAARRHRRDGHKRPDDVSSGRPGSRGKVPERHARTRRSAACATSWTTSGRSVRPAITRFGRARDRDSLPRRRR